MGMGRRRREVQQELWVVTASLPDVPRHVFYEKLNRLLAQSEFVTDSESAAAGGVRAGVLRYALVGRGAQASFEQDGGRRFDLSGSQRGDSNDRFHHCLQKFNPTTAAI